MLVGATFGAQRQAQQARTERPKQRWSSSSSPCQGHAGRTAQHRATQASRPGLRPGLPPKLLLLDELAAGLTTGELGDLMAIIRKIREQGVTIFMVEHIMRVIMGLCDRLAVIQYGTKIAEGPTQEVLQNPTVLEAYLGKRSWY